MGVASVFIFLLCKTDSFIHAVVCVSMAVGLSTFNNRLEWTAISKNDRTALISLYTVYYIFHAQI